ISLDRAARPWTQDPVDRPIVVPLLCQGPLHLRGHIARRGVSITEDGTIVNIVAVIGIIPVGGIPPPAIPIPITATVPDEAVIGVRRDVRLSLLVLVIAVGGNLLIAARLRGDMLLTGLRAHLRLSTRLRADAPIACLRPAFLWCGRRLGGLRFFLLLFLLIVGLRGLDRCQAHQ